MLHLKVAKVIEISHVAHAKEQVAPVLGIEELNGVQSLDKRLERALHAAKPFAFSLSVACWKPW